MSFRPVRRCDDESRGRVSSLLVATLVTVAAVIGVGFGGDATVSAAECDVLSVPSVAVERCIVPGRQAEIDAGNVARVPDLSTATGHWLAGHRSTHGSTFGPLTDLEIGDVLTYQAQQYRIVEYTTARFASPGHVLGWTSMDVPTVVLQTSVDNVRAHLWRAEAISIQEVVAAAAAHEAQVHSAVASVFAPLRSNPSRIAAMSGAAF